ncbi:hypothetical protein GGI04_006148, partial [Coemansia thaxteri]
KEDYAVWSLLVMRKLRIQGLAAVVKEGRLNFATEDSNLASANEENNDIAVQNKLEEMYEDACSEIIVHLDPKIWSKYAAMENAK